MTLLFAYASNLNRERMAERCPTAEPLGTGVLADHRLVFRHGADLEPHAGATAVGVVWRLGPDDMIALDHYEGFPGLYRKDYRLVQLAGGEAVEAIVREGYQDFGLSEAVLDAAVELTARLKPAISGLPRRPGFH